MARSPLILDRYRVIDQAGSGGYGTVVHAFDTHLKRDVAIKCIELSEDELARCSPRGLGGAHGGLDLEGGRGRGHRAPRRGSLAGMRVRAQSRSPVQPRALVQPRAPLRAILLAARRADALPRRPRISWAGPATSAVGADPRRRRFTACRLREVPPGKSGTMPPAKKTWKAKGSGRTPSFPGTPPRPTLPVGGASRHASRAA